MTKDHSGERLHSEARRTPEHGHESEHIPHILGDVC